MEKGALKHSQSCVDDLNSKLGWKRRKPWGAGVGEGSTDYCVWGSRTQRPRTVPRKGVLNTNPMPGPEDCQQL